ncbi:MAG TPA: peroxiredoxin [Hyphomicrobiaceae bacterium]|nr:peroxiredoxin [Hyphomicrobiaceae bacterium]
MPTPANPNLLAVDWSKIPAPIDDGAARHLEGSDLPDIALPATDSSQVLLARRAGRVVVFAYPRTGEPGKPALAEDWDMIPGARGCTPQACAFRDLHGELIAAGATGVFGLSTQDTGYQLEAVKRLHLPFSLLSDARLALTKALSLPTMEVAGRTLIKRLALVIDEGRIAKIFYPVFPPDKNATEVRGWLLEHQRQ